MILAPKGYQSVVSGDVKEIKNILYHSPADACTNELKTNQMTMHTARATENSSDNTSWQQFTVEYQYPVIFSEHIFAATNPILLDTITRLESEKCHRCCIFIDEGVLDAIPDLINQINDYFERYHHSITLSGPPIVMPAGETIKNNSAHITHMQKIVSKQGIDRHSYILGIGGGALLDAVGLVAATSHRGIRHIRIPTTVLAQNDSGVGVKNGVNLFGQKNYLGTFAPPFAVINDYQFIESLPARDKIAGMSEAVKVALIRDAEFFGWLEDNAAKLRSFDKPSMRYMIKRCAELHMNQIAKGGDPFESGSARPLDFGHWSAHRLETMTQHDIRHGEAVAIGIALDARYSVLSSLLDSGKELRIYKLLKALGATLQHTQLTSRSPDGQLSVVAGLTEFKEHLGGELTITLLEDIGVGVEVHAMNEDLIEESISWLNSEPDATQDTYPVIAANDPSNAPKIETIFSAVSDDSELNIQAVLAHLSHWVKARTEPSEFDWLKTRLQQLKTDYSDRDLYITLGLVPRKLSRDDLTLSAIEIESAQRDCGRDWNPSDWSIDAAARCLVICTLQQLHPEQFEDRFSELCKTAELNEAIAFYRCTAVLPKGETLDSVIGSGLRTHIAAIFQAIAYRNPYPRLHFSQNRWNHMVLKALFIDSQLWPILGIDERSNPELARILCDYAHERWAAHREVTPELWRCVGPYAEGSMLDDLQYVLQDSNELQQQAALLALLSCPNANHNTLQAAYPMWCKDIESGALNWDSIGRRFGLTKQ